MHKLAVLAAALFLVSGTATGQDLGETLDQVNSVYAQSYVTPLGEAIGTNFNSGLVKTTRWSNNLMGLNISIGVKAFATFIPSDERMFDISYNTRRNVTVQQDGETFTFPMGGTVNIQDAPSIFGEEDAPTASVRIQGDTTIVRNGQSYDLTVDETQTFETIGGLVNTSAVPLLVPEAYIGTVYGTDLMIRWLPQISYPDLGSVEVIGLGIRHSVDQYIPLLPIGLGVTVAWQKMSMDDADDNQVVDATMLAANIAASKGFGPLMVYGGLQAESSSVRIAYTYTPDLDDVDVDPIAVDFEVDGGNPFRAIAGFGLNLGPLNFGADVNVGNRFMVSTGIGLAF